jgi:hypothetical protein
MGHLEESTNIIDSSNKVTVGTMDDHTIGDDGSGIENGENVGNKRLPVTHFPDNAAKHKKRDQLNDVRNDHYDATISNVDSVGTISLFPHSPYNFDLHFRVIGFVILTLIRESSSSSYSFSPKH